jgi:hypothetical protein
MVAQFSRTIQAPSYDSEDSLESTSVGFNKSLTIEAFEQLREELSDLSIQYLNILRRTGEKFYNAVNGCDSEEVSGIREYSLIAKRYSAFKKTAEQARILYRETADDSQFEKVTVLVEKVSMINGFNTAMSVAKKAHLIPDEKIDYLEGLLFESEDGEKVDGIKAKDIALASKPPEWMETHRVEWVDKANDAEGGKRPIAKGYIVDIEENESDFILRVKLDNKDEILPVEGRKLKILPMPKCSNFVVIRERGESCNKQGILLNQEFNEQGELIGKVTLLDDSSIVSVPFKLIEKIGFPDNIVDKILDPSKLSGTEFVEELKTENSKLKTEVEELKKVPVVDEGLADLARSLESTLQEKEVAIAELNNGILSLESENSTLKTKIEQSNNGETSSPVQLSDFKKVTSISECMVGDFIFLNNGDCTLQGKVKAIKEYYLEAELTCKTDSEKFKPEQIVHNNQLNSGELLLYRMAGKIEYVSKVSKLETKIKELKIQVRDLQENKKSPEEKELIDLQYKVSQLEDLVKTKDEANEGIVVIEDELMKTKRTLAILSEKVLIGFYKEDQEVSILNHKEHKNGVIKKITSQGVALVETEDKSSISLCLGSLLPKN